jgi:hypothetical protein
VSRVGRLAGALLAETGGAFFLVGNLKRPCDFAAAGFEPPPVPMDALVRPWVPLSRSGPLAVGGPWIGLRVEGEVLPRLLAERLLIARTGAVSDRLWRLIRGEDEEGNEGDSGNGNVEVLDAGWLGEMPGRVWDVVRDSVLRCT